MDLDCHRNYQHLASAIVCIALNIRLSRPAPRGAARSSSAIRLSERIEIEWLKGIYISHSHHKRLEPQRHPGSSDVYISGYTAVDASLAVLELLRNA